jgi:hypothetical protein
MFSTAIWKSAFESVCRRGDGALQWGLPEPWIHAELFAELSQMAPQTGMAPIAHEVPDVTHCPVVIPKRRDLATRGAVKWVDLCLHSEDKTQYLWFEFKIRHAGRSEREEQADASSMDAVRKDIAALIGFDLALTEETWRNPDGATKSHWMPTVLGPLVDSLPITTHHFVMAYIKLDGELDPGLWNQASISKAVSKWLPKRSKVAVLPDMAVGITDGIAGRHSLMLAEWSSAPL